MRCYGQVSWSWQFFSRVYFWSFAWFLLDVFPVVIGIFLIGSIGIGSMLYYLCIRCHCVWVCVSDELQESVGCLNDVHRRCVVKNYSLLEVYETSTGVFENAASSSKPKSDYS